MSNFSIKIGGRTHIANKPKMKTLKAFLKAKGDGDNLEINADSIDSLNEVIKSIFPKVKSSDLDELEISEYVSMFQEIADWIGESMGNDTSKN